MTHSQIEFYLRELRQLVGYRIVGLAKDNSGEFYGLELSNNGQKKLVWFLMDDEGNGPGSFEIQDVQGTI